MMQDNKRLVMKCAIALVFLAGLYFFIFGKGTSDEKKSDLALSSTPRSDANQNSLNSLINAPRIESPQKFEIKAHSETGVDPKCLSFAEEIQRLDLNLWNFPPRLERLPRPPECKNVPAEYLKAQNNYEENCASLFNQITPPMSAEEWKKRSGTCGVYLSILRSAITEWQYQGVRLGEIADLRVLSDLLVSSLALSFDDPASTIRLIEVANRMLEIDPILYGAAKADLSARVLKYMHDPKIAESDPNFWAALDRSFERVLQLNINDSEVQSIGLFVKTRGFKPELIQGVGKQMVDAHPDSYGYEVLGYGAWKTGSKSEAYRYLQKAMEIAPNDAGIKKIWDDIHAPHAGPESYKLGIRFSISAESLSR
jgi:tetratricopeptide (TPR) repeat protein